MVLSGIQNGRFAVVIKEQEPVRCSAHAAEMKHPAFSYRRITETSCQGPLLPVVLLGIQEEILVHQSDLPDNTLSHQQACTMLKIGLCRIEFGIADCIPVTALELHFCDTK